MVVAGLQRPRLDRFRVLRSGGEQNSSCLCRHRTRETSTYEGISYSLRIASGITDVFRAPETNITAWWLFLASVQYLLTRT